MHAQPNMHDAALATVGWSSQQRTHEAPRCTDRGHFSQPSFCRSRRNREHGQASPAVNSQLRMQFVALSNLGNMKSGRHLSQASSSNGCPKRFPRTNDLCQSGRLASSTVQHSRLPGTQQRSHPRSARRSADLCWQKAALAKVTFLTRVQNRRSQIHIFVWWNKNTKPT